MVRGFFLHTMTHFFADHDTYRWSPDRRNSEIFIQEDMAIDARHEDITPAVIVEDAGNSITPTGVNNSMFSVFQKDNLYQGVSRHDFVVQGQIMIHTISNSTLEAEALAWEISVLLLALKSFTMETLRLQNLTLPSISKAHPIRDEGWDNAYGVTISLGYSFSTSIIVDPKDYGELLKEIEFSLVNDIENKVRNKNNGLVEGDNGNYEDPNYPGNGGGNKPDIYNPAPDNPYRPVSPGTSDSVDKDKETGPWNPDDFENPDTTDRLAHYGDACLLKFTIREDTNTVEGEQIFKFKIN